MELNGMPVAVNFRMARVAYGGLDLGIGDQQATHSIVTILPP
jgi:hypothetical protein